MTKILNALRQFPAANRRDILAALRTVVLSTLLAFAIRVAIYLLAPLQGVFRTYAEPLRPYWPEQTVVFLLSLLLLVFLSNFHLRVWHSFRLGLIPLRSWIWTPALVFFWLTFAFGHRFAAWVAIAVIAGLTWAAEAAMYDSPSSRSNAESALESDLPLPEDGEDLLGRADIINALVAILLLEQPTNIAVTGGYGEGKTSLLNLTIGKLRKIERQQRPVIVKFSPWLARDPDALVLALLNSVVAEIRRNYIAPGLGRDAVQYAKTLLGVIPKADRLKELITEPSQEERITALAEHISRTTRRVIVVLDDLDRMEARELETVFKILRGSERFSDITFLCSFDRSEVSRILKAARPNQDIGVFVEKFFPLTIPLPKVESAQRRDLFTQRMRKLVMHYDPSENVEKSLEQVWDRGGEFYFSNLRRVKLFVNKMSQSLQRIAGEVNILDLTRLELIRDVSPELYETIYRNPGRFYTRGFAFETVLKDSEPLDEKQAAKERAQFYSTVEAAVPEDKSYVLLVLEDLFPAFAGYRKKFGLEQPTSVEAEKARRIFHPRFFRRYFTLRVPSELVGEKEFKAFVSRLKSATEKEARDIFGEGFESLISEDFKRWHFMHLIENSFGDFGLEVAAGLCIGMAIQSGSWTVDAFELATAVDCTRSVLTRMSESSRRRDFLRSIILQSGSDLYTLHLFRRLEEKFNEEISTGLPAGVDQRALGFRSPPTQQAANALSDLKAMKEFISEHLRKKYLALDGPSVFEQFGSSSAMGLVQPNYFQLEWRKLSTDSAMDQMQYFRRLLQRRPQDLKIFLNSMFRVDFIDDYQALKPLIDYAELAKLIDLNEASLDKEKVEKFRSRLAAEISSVPNADPEKTEVDDGDETEEDAGSE